MSEYTPISLFVTQNEKGQFIYSGPFTKGGYVIAKSDYSKFRTYSLRYVLGIIVGALISTFIKPIPSVIVGLATALVGEFLFRFKFLKTCTYIPNFTKKESIISTLTKSGNNKKKIIKTVLFLAFGILIVLNAYIENYTGLLFYCSWAVGILAIVIFIIYVISFIKDGGTK